MQKCIEYDMRAVMTSKDYDTPTSRLCEVSTIIDADLYTLIMGDEPLVNEECFSLIISDSFDGNFYVGALTNILSIPTEVIDFSNQKVVTNSKRETLFIFRSLIPYPKGTLDFQYEKATGVQIFSKKALEFFHEIEKSVLEKAEENDLMRFIENGIPVKMTVSNYKMISVDMPKDFINPINIMGYSDEKILWIIDQVNKISPYQFSIVDTFGSMKRRDLDRIVSLVDNSLDCNIRVALHLHENMSSSCCLAQNFVDWMLFKIILRRLEEHPSGGIFPISPFQSSSKLCRTLSEKRRFN